MSCPICRKTFHIDILPSHVNDCLNDMENHNENSSENSSEKVVSFFSGYSKKRKSDGAWGSLQPQKLTKTCSKTNSQQKQICHGNEGTHPDIDNESIVIDEKDNNSEESETSRKQCDEPDVVMQGNNSKSVLNKLKLDVPLAELVRPKTLVDYVGQSKAVGHGHMLRDLLESNQIPSMILWGPPGCGKTTLARIIGNSCKKSGSARFVTLSATSSGVNDVKNIITSARNDLKMLKRKTILFLDEIHRYNKSQQDSLLPCIEDGSIILIGATTENPSFRVNSALLSRCRVTVLDKLSVDDMTDILMKAVKTFDVTVVTAGEVRKDKPDGIYIEKEALEMLSNLCDGDARAALNGLQMALQATLKMTSSDELKQHIITSKDIKDSLQRSHVLYDKTGEEHYNIISALHKSIRGSDDSAALYWLARMLEGGEDPLYVARRLVRIASEDVGLADPAALPQAVSTYQACHVIGMPECNVILAQCVVYLARAAKSVEVYEAYKRASDCVKNQKGPMPSVPLHLRNASTKLMKSLGYGKGYEYTPHGDGSVKQDYFPECLTGTNFFK